MYICFMRQAIIVQARTGSTRLPNKVCLPFFQGKSILEILLKRLQQNAAHLPVILATTVHPQDDPVHAIGQAGGVAVFRGDEEDVLDRFVQAARTHEVEGIIRVCADNPFFDLEQLDVLVAAQEAAPQVDYLSFSFDGIKSTIRTHIGLFGEATRLDSLEAIAAETDEKFYHEHLTAYLYREGSQFSQELLAVPNLLEGRTDLRLTLDTPEDFAYQQELYTHVLAQSPEPNISTILKVIEQNPTYLQRMKHEMERQQK